MPPLNHPILPPVAYPRLLLFDPWNTASTGHQRADGYKDPLYKLERERKLQLQFEGPEKNKVNRTTWEESGRRKCADIGKWVKRRGKAGLEESSAEEKAATWVKKAKELENKERRCCVSTYLSGKRTSVLKEKSLPAKPIIEEKQRATVNAPAALKKSKPGISTRGRKRRREESEDGAETREAEEEIIWDGKEWWEEIPPSSQIPSQQEDVKSEQEQLQGEGPTIIEKRRWNGNIRHKRDVTEVVLLQTEMKNIDDVPTIEAFSQLPNSAAGDPITSAIAAPAERVSTPPFRINISNSACINTDDEQHLHSSNIPPSALRLKDLYGLSPQKPPLPGTNMNTYRLPSAPGKKTIFANLTVLLSGPTLPLISDQALKHLLTAHGARIALHMASRGARAVTHVILGRPSSSNNDHHTDIGMEDESSRGRSGKRRGGAGGLLAGSKLQTEELRGGKGRGMGGAISGKGGVRYVSVEWVLESVRAGIRLQEGGFGVSIGGGSGYGIENGSNSCKGIGKYLESRDC